MVKLDDTITIKVKISLWNAIKLRIAGSKNIKEKDIEFE